MHAEGINSTVNQLMAQIQGLQDKVNSLNEAREFDDPETASSSGLSHHPSQPVSIPSHREMISRGSCLQCMVHGTHWVPQETFLKVSALVENRKNLSSFSCGSRPIDTGRIAEQGERMRQDPQGSTKPTPLFAWNPTTWNFLSKIVLEEIVLKIV